MILNILNVILSLNIWAMSVMGSLPGFLNKDAAERLIVLTFTNTTSTSQNLSIFDSAASASTDSTTATYATNTLTAPGVNPVSDPAGIANSVLYLYNTSNNLVNTFTYFTGTDADIYFVQVGSVDGWFDPGGSTLIPATSWIDTVAGINAYPGLIYTAIYNGYFAPGISSITFRNYISGAIGNVSKISGVISGGVFSNGGAANGSLYTLTGGTDSQTIFSIDSPLPYTEIVQSLQSNPILIKSLSIYDLSGNYDQIMQSFGFVTLKPDGNTQTEYVYPSVNPGAYQPTKQNLEIPKNFILNALNYLTYTLLGDQTIKIFIRYNQAEIMQGGEIPLLPPGSELQDTGKKLKFTGWINTKWKIEFTPLEKLIS